MKSVAKLLRVDRVIKPAVRDNTLGVRSSGASLHSSGETCIDKGLCQNFIIRSGASVYRLLRRKLPTLAVEST